jgi:hypothetical protein
MEGVGEMKQETITITKEEYFNLRKADLEIDLLENNGVDNWEGYCDSFSDENYSQVLSKLRKELFGEEAPND